MMIDERRRCRTPVHARGDDPADVAAHLLRRWRNAGNGPAIGLRDGRGVADREDLGPPGNAKIGVHLDASGAIVLGADPLRRRRGDDTRGPDHRGRLDAAAIERQRPAHRSR